MAEEKQYTRLDDKGYAPQSGWVRAWNYSEESGELFGPVDQWVEIGTGVSAWSTATPPPDAVKGQAVLFRNGQWAAVPDHRGETVYSTQDQSPSVVSLPGDYPADTTPLKPATKYDKWDGVKWVTDTDAQQKGDSAAAGEKKAALLAEANTFTGPWQTQLMLGIISDADKASLTTWMRYYQQVQATDTGKLPVTFPAKPA